jgi:hypothetical protein
MECGYRVCLRFANNADSKGDEDVFLRMSLQNGEVVDAPTPPTKFHDSAAATEEADDAPTPPTKKASFLPHTRETSLMTRALAVALLSHILTKNHFRGEF